MNDIDKLSAADDSALHDALKNAIWETARRAVTELRYSKDEFIEYMAAAAAEAFDEVSNAAVGNQQAKEE
jgi:hypothetical protein